MRTVMVFLTVSLLYVSAGGYDFLGTVNGEALGDQFGSAFCTVDFNADGFPDLIVSAPAADQNGASSGKVYIYFGGPAADMIADLEIVGPASSFFGQALSSAGDFNHDGYEDLLVGAPFYDVPATSAGAVLLYYGGPSPDTTVDHMFTGENESDYFGIAVAGVGDFNNDTYDDIAIGAYRADWESYSNAGKVYLYYGSVSPEFTIDKILVGLADGERFGYAITSGDFDGNGTSDIAVGAYSFDAAQLNMGRIYLFDGGTDPDSINDMTITGTTKGLKYGWSLSSGLINDDIYIDLVMGTDGYAVDTFPTGQVYVFHGGPIMDDNYDDSYTLGRMANDYLGFSIYSGLDIGGDGNHEIIAGMPGNDDNQADAGGAVLLAGGNTVSVDTTLIGSSSDEEMGFAVGLWQGYGNMNSFIFTAGAAHYDDYRGRIFLYLKAGAAENRAPVLDPIGYKFGIINELLTFTVTATDIDGDVVNLFAENLPSGADFTYNGWDSNISKYKGTFNWLPNSSQEGTFENVRFVADDGELTDDEYIAITVGSFICGDVNADGDVNLTDILNLISYVYVEPIGEPEPIPPEAGDVNNSDGINLTDILNLITHVYIDPQLELNCPPI